MRGANKLIDNTIPLSFPGEGGKEDEAKNNGEWDRGRKTKTV